MRAQIASLRVKREKKMGEEKMGKFYTEDWWVIPRKFWVEFYNVILRDSQHALFIFLPIKKKCSFYFIYKL